MEISGGNISVVKSGLASESHETLHKVLEKYFGYTVFLWQQEDIINHILAGRHALVVAPTGIGKSICYQIPAIINDELTVVISPLIALMKDQVDVLNKRGIDATYINSSIGRGARDARYAALKNGKYSIIYVTPERFRKSEFVECIAGRAIGLLAIDEAHCISEWGHDFRPDYTRMHEIKGILGDPVTIALTATATPEVQKDIIKTLHIDAGDMKIFHAGIDRPNLRLEVENVFGSDEKLEHLIAIANRYNGNGIVYFNLIKQLDNFSELLDCRKIPHLCYHGKLEQKQRAKVQEIFMEKQDVLVLATNAFGMGIDKEDIRFVTHVDIPGSIESYYQEIGRAGRDGKDSLCTLLYDEHDLLTQMEFVKWNNPDAEYYRCVYRALENMEEISAYGIDRLKENIYFGNRHDFRLETVLNMFDRFGVIERGANPSDIKIISSLRPQLQDRNYLDAKLKRDLQKLYTLVQYTKHEGDRKAFIHEYFGIGGGGEKSNS
ncbi:MAG: RecQ family ATP-dependent DNA helicase [Candidatus Anammoxibacter sp.]